MFQLPMGSVLCSAWLACWHCKPALQVRATTDARLHAMLAPLCPTLPSPAPRPKHSQHIARSIQVLATTDAGLRAVPKDLLPLSPTLLISYDLPPRKVGLAGCLLLAASCAALPKRVLLTSCDLPPPQGGRGWRCSHHAASCAALPKRVLLFSCNLPPPQGGRGWRCSHHAASCAALPKRVLLFSCELPLHEVGGWWPLMLNVWRTPQCSRSSKFPSPPHALPPNARAACHRSCTCAASSQCWVPAPQRPAVAAASPSTLRWRGSWRSSGR